MIDYKQVALDGFYDALALYKAERYSASFYMAGYVIEIGVKHKFVELGNTSTEKVNLNVISYILTGTKKTKLPNFKEIANIASKFNKKESQDLSYLKMVTLQRAPSASENRFHDTCAFIEGLFYWYEVFGHPDTGVLRKFIYTGNFSHFYGGSDNEDKEPTLTGKKTNWSVELRYEPSDKIGQSEATEHLALCLSFLQKILKYKDEDINEYEKVTKLLNTVNDGNQEKMIDGDCKENQIEQIEHHIK